MGDDRDDASAPRFRLSLPRACAITLLLALAAISCGTDTAIRPDELRDPFLQQLEARFPEGAPLLAQALRYPARVDANGARFVLTPPLPATPRPMDAGKGGRFVPGPVAPQVSLSQNGKDSFEVAIPGGALRVRHAGARASRGRVERGAVVYDAIGEGTDAVAFATESGVEELVRLDSAARRPAYDVDLPGGWTLSQPKALPGVVEVRDARNVSRVRFRASKAWGAGGQELAVGLEVVANRVTLHLPETTRGAVLVDPLWESAGTLLVGRQSHTATTLTSGSVLLVGGLDPNGVPIALSEIYDPSLGTFSATGSLAHAVFLHTATLLTSGLVLVAGGGTIDGSPVPEELYDPSTGTFFPTGPSIALAAASATRLPSGLVLIAGGASPDSNKNYTLPSVASELFDPSTGSLSSGAPMSVARAFHTATLLASGAVLVAGGNADGSSTFEVFDPTSQTFSKPGSLSTYRDTHTATLLPSGAVLVAGGKDITGNALSSAELYDPSTQTFSLTGPLSSARYAHTASLLPSGTVLFAGGWDTNLGPLASAEEYLPGVGVFESTEALTTARGWAFASLLPSGSLLITGGSGQSNVSFATTEAYVPTETTEQSAGALFVARLQHTASALPSGQVLVAGGTDSYQGGTQYAETEMFDPTSNRFSSGASMAIAHSQQTATTLQSGSILIAGGFDGLVIADAEIYDPTAGAFLEAGPLNQARWFHTATLLASGEVLVAGGTGNNPGPLGTAELYNPAAGTFSTTGPLVAARQSHVAAALPSGQVLLAGGYSGYATASGFLTTGEIYDPQSGTFRLTKGNMTSAREGATATLLPTGQGLIAGGADSSSVLRTAELYDPATDSFSATGVLSVPRLFHTATLLPSGKVLLVGGNAGPADIFDPATGTFQPTGSSLPFRQFHSATLLSSGKVLVVGGSDEQVSSTSTSSGPLASALLFDPAMGDFTPLVLDAPSLSNGTLTLLPSNQLLLVGGYDANGVSSVAQIFDPILQTVSNTGSLATARANATATLLPTGRVLVAGGWEPANAALTSAESYDPVAATFAPAGALTVGRFDHTATLLPTGNVLLVAGSTANGPTSSVEIFNSATGTFAAVGNLQVARTGHAAALLSSGQVAITGGTDSSGNPIASVEVFDVPSGQTVAIASTTPSSDVAAVALPNGNALLAYDTTLQEYISPTYSRSFGAAALGPFSATLWLSGDAVVCTPTTCQDFASGLQTTTDSFPQSVASTTTGVARLADGTLFLEGAGAFGIVQTLPSGVARPTISSLSSLSITSDSILTVSGTGFEHMSAVGASSLPAIAASVPLVFFMPSEGGGPVFGSVQGGWTDTSLAWQVPRTNYPGPGWVHVVVDGVPSVGAFVSLVGLATATPCASDSECVTGFCVGTVGNRVCCNTICNGGCESCLASEQSPGGQDGTCGPRSAGSVATAGCEPTADATCSTTGHCNGKGDCDYPPTGTPCTTSAISDGICAGGICAAVPPTPPVNPVKTTCATTADCPSGQQCDVTGHCAIASFPAAATDPGACAVSSLGKARSGAWIVGVPLALLARRRRRRQPW